MLFQLLIFIIPFIFYIAVPLGGAFLIRRNWMMFRRHLIATFQSPIISYGADYGESSEKVRCFGKVQGYSKDRTIWLRNESSSLLVDLKYCRIYQIPTAERKELQKPEDFERINFRLYRRMFWNEFQRLPEGSRLYVIGNADPESSRMRIQGTKKEPVYAVLYEGDEETVVSRSLWGGRQFNEAWNSWTLWSVPIGFFLMITLFSFYMQIDSLRNLFPLVMTLTLMPLIFLLPPGLLFFLSYLKLWNIARLYRARRDLFDFYRFLKESSERRKSSDFLFLDGIFQESEGGSSKKKYYKIRLVHFFSALCFISGIILNFILAYPIIKNIF